MINKRIKIFTDFDGTITKKDLGDEIFKIYGQFEPYHTQLIHKEIGIKEYWRLLFKTLPKDLTELEINKHALTYEIDAYFMDFVNFCNEMNIELSVVSDGFEQYIKPILDKLKLNHITVKCNKMLFTDDGIIPFFSGADESCNCMSASCKRNAVINYAYDDTIIVFIGDGYSDFCAAEHSDIIFAKRNLAVYCNENKIPHHHFGTFFDIIQILKKILKEKSRIKQRNQALIKRKLAFESE